jgi:hypothetical protein
MAYVPVLDATERPYESNPFKLLNPSIEALKIMGIEALKLMGIWILVVLTLLIPAIIGIVSIQSNGVSAASMALIAMSVVLFLASAFYFQYTLVRMALASARGVKLTWRESLPSAGAEVWKFAGTAFLVGFIVMLGFLLLLVPGIIFALWYSQVGYVAVEEKIYGFAALRRSKALVRKRLMDTFGIQGMTQLFALSGYVPIFGSIASIVFSFIIIPLMPIRYLQLTQLSDEERKTTPTNGWNYALLIMAILVPIVALGMTILLIATGTYDAASMSQT